MILQKIFDPIVCFSATKLPGGVYFNHESPLKKGQKNNLKLNVIVNFVVKFYEKNPTTVHVFSTPHCPKLKMNDKKPSQYQFYFSGLLFRSLFDIFLGIQFFCFSR